MSNGRDRVTRCGHLSVERLHHRLRRLHRQQPRRSPASHDGHASTAYDNFSTGQRRFLDDAARSPTVSRSSKATCSTERADRARCAAATSSSTSRRTPTSASAPSIRAATSSRTRSRTFNVLEAMRANGVRRIAFSSTGSIYGEPDDLPDAGGRAVPGSDVAVRRLEARRRRADPGLLRRLRLPGLHLPLRVDPGRALFARPRLRLLPQPPRQSRASSACWATASSASPTSTSRTASTRCCWRSRRPGDKVNIFNLGTDEYCQVNDSIGWITGHLGLEPGAELHRRRARLDRRQPVHLSRHRAGSASLGWKPKLTIREGVIRTLDYLQREPVAAGGAAHEGVRARSLAPRAR